MEMCFCPYAVLASGVVCKVVLMHAVLYISSLPFGVISLQTVEHELLQSDDKALPWPLKQLPHPLLC